MADEFIDILSDDSSVIKTCLKSKAHKNGWLHASVHIWFYTNDGKILLQKRAKDKIAFPNLWDVSVAGHVSAGEDAIITAIREVKEEIGIEITKKNLVKIGIFKEQFQHQVDFIDNEIHHIYVCKLSYSLDQLNFQKEEISDLKLIDIQEFKELRKQSGFTTTYTPHYSKYYDFILKKLEDYV